MMDEVESRLPLSGPQLMKRLLLLLALPAFHGIRATVLISLVTESWNDCSASSSPRVTAASAPWSGAKRGIAGSLTSGFRFGMVVVGRV